MIKHKFHAQRCERDERKFASKRERAFYDQLKLRQKAGDILFFLMQVPFALPGGLTYRADFMIFEKDHVRIVDIKGFETKEFVMKKKLLEETYPFELEIIK